MLTNLRRLLTHLPLISGSRAAQYIKPSWHKPTPFDQWKSQPPFRPMTQPMRGEYFGRGQRRQRVLRVCLGAAGAIAAVWLVVESVRGLALL